jgi:signal transduction histidine kinase
MVKGAPIGYFGVANDTPHCFTDKQVTIAKAFADHASVAIENARLYEQAHALAVLEERQRLARDLHDSVAQAMYGVALGAKAARKYLDKDVEAIEPMDYVISLAAAGLAEMRALIFDLHPGAIAEEGIVNAVKRQVTAAEARHGLSVDFNAVEPEADLKAKEAVYSVVREALHNVVKHAQASTVAVAIEAVDGSLNFSVIDDGIGFDPAATGPGHMGLQSMRERIERMGGTISIDSEQGHGSKVAGSLPR